MKKISIVSGCYNEKDNVDDLCNRIHKVMEAFVDRYEYEIIIVDNCSVDGTQDRLRELARDDERLKLIFNARNFGHIRSPYYGIINAYGDAVIYLASDLQDPPELISEFIQKWELGFKIVLAQKNQSEESLFMSAIRRAFYSVLRFISDDETELVQNYTGFGLYDKRVIDIARMIDDPYPYFRGLISEIGFERAIVKFKQPLRKKGKTKNNFYTLYDNAMIGIVKHSKVPLRLMTFVGFVLATVSMAVAVGYFAYKLLFWDRFNLGIAPVVIGLFFFASVQLFSLGIIGEYVGAIYTRVNKKPLVVEKERINF